MPRSTRRQSGGGNPAPSFSVAKDAFDAAHENVSILPRSLAPVNGEYKDNIPLRGTDGRPLEEYYKWQFIYALIHSGLYAKDYLGAEVYFPKGSWGANPLKIDAAVFDDPEWVTHYDEYWTSHNPAALQWLNDHLLAVVEFKRDGAELEQVFTRQVKPAMREKEPTDAYVLGVYYDRGRLLLFHRKGGRYLRYDEPKNQKGDASGVGDLSLHLPDPYLYLPSFEELKNLVHRPSRVDRSNRGVRELEVITSIATAQIQAALSHVLRAMDKSGLVNQRGYQILIETFALKIFAEKRNERNPGKKLDLNQARDFGDSHMSVVVTVGTDSC